MYSDTIRIAEGATLDMTQAQPTEGVRFNVTVLPASPEEGVIYVLEQQDGNFAPGLYFYRGGAWRTDAQTAGFGIAIEGTEIKVADTATPYDVATRTFGKPADNEVIIGFIVPRAFNLPVNFAGSYLKVGTAPTANTTFLVKKNGTQIGTCLVSAAGVTGVFTVAQAQSLVAGDLLEIYGPATADATLADIYITLKGNLQ